MLNEIEVVAAVQEAIGNPLGQCYPASEVIYHLCGGVHAYTPMRGDGHWWLRRLDGSVLDVTAAQYPHGFDYSVGKGGGFLTKFPSARAREIITKLPLNQLMKGADMKS